MDEQSTAPAASRWITAPFTWASKAANAAVNTTSALFTRGPVLTATLVATQITTAGGDFCFRIPNEYAPYWFDCVNSQQLANLTRLLESNASAVAVPLFQCYETAYEFSKAYGTTYFNSAACGLLFDNRLNPLVDTILSNNVVSGIFGGGSDIASAIMISAFGTAGLLGVMGIGYCIFKGKCNKTNAKLMVTEHDRLVSTDREEDRGQATTRNIYKP